MPNVKLIEKKRVGSHGEKIKRIYDRAKTPYQRVSVCGQVSEEVKQSLREQYNALNPADLRRRIQSKLEQLNQINYLIINQIVGLEKNAKVTFSHRSTN